jgi:release factor glutamine methyltransferase
LREAGIPGDEADLDARLLAERVLGWDAARLLTRGDEPEPAGFAHAYDALVVRRAAREPMAYLLGRREFWGLEFDVTPAVLIPRPETELIVEVALATFPEAQATIDIADIGTGSGCLAVTLAHERRAAHIVATDVSPAALDVARRNAAQHAVASRVELIETDLLNGIDRTFDLIVSNPPYVPERDRATLPPEVREHEPSAALFGGSDGLAVVRRLAQHAAPRLKPGGVLIFEFGFGQADSVKEIVSRAPGLGLLDVRSDLQGIPRVAIIERS